jgi:hypothetical protein
LHPAGFAPKLPAVRFVRVLFTLPLLLLAPLPLPAQEAADIEQVGPWRMMCYRGDKLYGHAYESCRAHAVFNEVGVYVDRNSKGLFGYLGGKRCPSEINTFRMSAGDLAPKKKNRAAALVSAIERAFVDCKQPPPGIDPSAVVLMLQRSDGLSGEWAAK